MTRRKFVIETTPFTQSLAEQYRRLQDGEIDREQYQIEIDCLVEAQQDARER